MLTKADDYPIHQTPEPIAFAGTDRNFYDRYFFNGYHRTEDIFFAAAMGQYPALNITDAAFCVIVDGVQHSLFASRILGMERMDTEVGPIAVDVIEPLKTLRLRIAPNDHGIEAELVFRHRTVPVQEPRFTRRVGTRLFMDLTRLTQFGHWEGWIKVGDRRIDVAAQDFVGTRDRSWGLRPIGAQDPQPMAPPVAPQFYWLWAPLNFPDGASMFHTNDESDGTFWNRSAVWVPDAPGAPHHYAGSRAEIEFKPGTRHAAETLLFLDGEDGETTVKLTPRYNFYMRGIGYGHPKWSHGSYHGELETGGEQMVLADADEADFPNNHIQAICDATMTLPDGTVRVGRGVLEQLIIGPHAPSGLHDLFDMAP